MARIVVGLVLCGMAAPAAAGDLDSWQAAADLVIRAEVVQVAAAGDAVTVVLDRTLAGPRPGSDRPEGRGDDRGRRPAGADDPGGPVPGFAGEERPPRALTFVPAPRPREPGLGDLPAWPDPVEGGGKGDRERWLVGDRAVLFLRRRADPGDGPPWESLAPRSALPSAENPLATADLDRYFGAAVPGGDRASREARAVEALRGGSPALVRHGGEVLAALAEEGPLGPTAIAAVVAAGTDREPLRRLGAVAALRGLSCREDRAAAALLERLAGDDDVEVAARARRAVAARCRTATEAGLAAGTEGMLVAGILVALGLLAGGRVLVRIRTPGPEA
jgi:hypothetical protein